MMDQAHSTNHTKSNKSVELDETMEITEQNGDGQEYQIRRFSYEEANQFDNLAHKHEGTLCDHCVFGNISGESLSSLQDEKDDQRVKGEGQ